MNLLIPVIVVTLLSGLLSACASEGREIGFAAGYSGKADLWVSAYYAGWTQGCDGRGRLSPEDIDFAAVTHVMHFALVPGPDGSVDYSKKCITPGNSRALVGAVHAAGRKVLVSVGGEASEPLFIKATEPDKMQAFINNLVTFMTARGYDGVDVDWEPISESFATRYIIFILELKKAMLRASPHALLTAATKSQPLLFSSLQDQFDQINVMTYCLSGPWPGWIVWHNAPLYNSGFSFPSGKRAVPSVSALLDAYISAGVPPRKLGIGIPFFGSAWTGGEGTTAGGVTAPGQRWTKAPAVIELPYYEIMDRYYRGGDYRWDAGAEASYISIDAGIPSRDMFISFDDERSCREKVRYARDNMLGGVMIFELGSGWRTGERIPDGLLKSIKDAVKGEGR